VRPMVLSGMVSQTIHRVPAWSSNSRSAMRHANCTDKTTAANPLQTARMAAWRCFGGSSLTSRDGFMADVPVVALPAADTMSPAPHLNDLGNMPQRRPDGPARADGLIGCPRAPAVEQPASGGCVDRLSGFVRCRPTHLTARLSAIVARIRPGVHVAEVIGLDSKY
jgi:hypothetical protein